MAIPVSNEQEWRLRYHEEVDPEGVPLYIEKEQGKTVLWAYEREIRIDLIKYDRKSQQIKGEYQIFDFTYPQNTISGDIVFKIDSQDEKKWIGFPTEFHCLCSWTIWPRVMQPERLPPPSQKRSLSLKSRIRKLFFGSKD